MKDNNYGYSFIASGYDLANNIAKKGLKYLSNS